MGDTINSIKQQLNEYWTKLTKKQKVIFISSVSATLVLLIILTVVFSSPKMVPLYSSPLSSSQVGEVTSKLDELKYSYQLQDDGSGNTNVLVDEKNKSKIKIQLEVANVPKQSNGITYDDVFKDTSLSVPNELRQQELLRAQENSMATTLKDIQGIKDASVTLNIPDKTLFIDQAQNQKPTAAVMLTLSDGLSGKQIKGIVNYVSKSVENLTPANVTVIDNNGNMLSDSNDNSDNSGSLSNMDIKNKQEEKIRQQVSSLLFGMGDSVGVSVNLNMNFDSKITESTNYTAPNSDGSGIVSNEQVDKESGTGGQGSTATGVPGTSTNSNITQYPSTTGNNNYSAKKNNYTREYKVNQTNSKIVSAVGTPNLNKSSIAVLLRKSQVYTTQKAYDNAKLKIINRADLVGTVRDATGISKVAVKEVITPLLELQPGFDATQFVNSYGAIIIAGLLILGLLIGLLRREKPGVVEQEVEIEELDMNNQENNIPRFEAAVGDEENVPDIELKENSEIQKQINKFVQEKPESVAQLLRNWLSEDWE